MSGSSPSPQPSNGLQRAVGRELGRLFSFATIILTLWSGASQYLDSRQRGTEWSRSSGQALEADIVKLGLAHQQRLDFLLAIPKNAPFLSSSELLLSLKREAGKPIVRSLSGATPSEKILEALLREMQDLWDFKTPTRSGFFTAEEKLYQVSLSRREEEWIGFISPLGGEWLQKQRIANAAEVVLINSEGQRFGDSFQGSSPTLEKLPNPGEISHQAILQEVQLSHPYQSRYESWHQGELAFQAFSSAHPHLSLSGDQIIAWTILLVPEDVILGWPTRSLWGLGLIAILISVFSLYRLRKLLDAHLSPLVSLVQKVEELHLQLGGRTFKKQLDVYNLNHLVRAVDALQIQLEESKKLEDQLRQAEKMEAIGNLAGGVAHDFNNLLSVLLLNSESISEDLKHLELSPLSESQRVEWLEMTKEMLMTCEQAKLLTLQLLSISRDQGGSSEAFAVQKSLQHSLKLLQRLLPEHIQITISQEPESLWVDGNENALQQVLINLVLNARDAITGSGEIEIKLSLSREEKRRQLTAGILFPREYAKLSVSDNGTGISEALLKRLFEPFFSSKGNKSTGLGLTVVLNTVVRQFEGAVDVESTLGEGSTFHCYLPRVQALPKTPTPSISSRQGMLAGRRVLLVEDHSQVRRALFQTLTGMGLDVVDFASGAALLKWLELNSEEPIDILVSDVVMPEMSGPELWQEVKMLRPELPALFLTGYAGDALARYQISPRQFLSKPVSSDLLYIRLIKLIRP
ncbi:MAG: ATP-binding protein [Myxococcota bacterium]|nr:ATP-binding protein [Myxococcota bacterium]